MCNNNVLTFFKQVFQVAWTVCIGYLPIGLVFGAMAGEIGISPLETGLMSLIVFAGSSQIIAVSMLTIHESFFSIIIVTLLVNLRHFLMSSSLSIYLSHIPKKWIFIFVHGITDESFAINNTKFKRNDWNWQQALALNIITNLFWTVFSVLGIFFGHFISFGQFGMGYILIALFIYLLIFQVKKRIHVLVTLIAGLSALVLKFWFDNLYIIIATIIAATFGFCWKILSERNERNKNDS